MDTKERIIAQMGVTTQTGKKIGQFNKGKCTFCGDDLPSGRKGLCSVCSIKLGEL